MKISIDNPIIPHPAISFEDSEFKIQKRINKFHSLYIQKKIAGNKKFKGYAIILCNDSIYLQRIMQGN